MEYTSKQSIKAWAEDDQPREKLLLKGKHTLSDAELIAILIGSGSRELSAVELSKSILNSVGNNLNELAKLTVFDLMKFKGIGEAKAISIVAAMEIGRRRKDATFEKNVKFKDSRVIYDYLKVFFQDLDHEQFWILLLKKNLELIKPVQISIGAVAGTVVDPKIVFKYAVENLASNIVLAHNHPSGNLNPSEQDINLTRKIKILGSMMGVDIIDHIIFTNEGYTSFANKGLLE